MCYNTLSVHTVFVEMPWPLKILLYLGGIVCKWLIHTHLPAVIEYFPSRSALQLTSLCSTLVLIELVNDHQRSMRAMNTSVSYCTWRGIRKMCASTESRMPYSVPLPLSPSSRVNKSVRLLGRLPRYKKTNHLLSLEGPAELLKEVFTHLCRVH